MFLELFCCIFFSVKVHKTLAVFLCWLEMYEVLFTHAVCPMSSFTFLYLTSVFHNPNIADLTLEYLTLAYLHVGMRHHQHIKHQVN